MAPSSGLSSRVIWVLMFLGLVTEGAAAQRSDSLAFSLETLAASLWQNDIQSTATRALPCRFIGGSGTLACEALVAARIATSTDDATRARDLLNRALQSVPRAAALWYGLGQVRLTLARLAVIGTGEPLQPVGTSQEYGAVSAFLQSLALDSTFTPALEALALAPMPRDGGSQLNQRLGLLRRSRSLLSPSVFPSVASLEREHGSVDSAIALERRALNSGLVDSGLIALGFARDLYRVGRASEGRAILFAGAHSPTKESHEAYAREIAWLASPREAAEWDTLAPTYRSEWLRAFWERRDVAGGWADGERLIEHFRRIEYAMVHFRITIPQSGTHAVMQTTPSTEFAPEYRARAEASRDPVSYPKLSQMVVLGRALSGELGSRYYQPIQNLVSDKGIVWVRHGQPDAVARSVLSEVAEVWRYDRPEGPLLLRFREVDFDGTVDASVLVPSLLTLPIPIRNQLCAVDVSICPISARWLPISSPRQLESEVTQEGARLGLQAIVRSGREGRAGIDEAVSTDSYRRRFAKGIVPIVQLYGLQRLTSGDSRIVMAFAIPGDQLQGMPTGSEGNRQLYEVRFQLMAAGLADGSRFDVDTIRRFLALTTLRSGEYLTGVIEMSIPPGLYTAGVVFTQSDGRGGVATLSSIRVPGGERGVRISDLVLGRSDGTIVWNSGMSTVHLNPNNSFSQGSPATAYSQLSGLHIGTDYRFRYQFFKVGDAPSRGPRLSIEFTQRASSEFLEVSHILGLRSIESGDYRLVVSVLGESGDRSAVARLKVVK